ncbi:hypothetical protein ACFL5G_03845 [Candidatus Margulisiibacteriota bacterium]
MTITPINPALVMGRSLAQGVGNSSKPTTKAETQTAFVELLLDQVFLKSFMTEKEGVFAPEKDDLFGNSQEMGLYQEIVRKEMIHQLAAEDRFGFAELFANVPSLPD